MKRIMFKLSAVLFCSAFADPVVTVDSISTNTVGDMVVEYSLSEDAIVTCDVMSGEDAVKCSLSGDVFTKIVSGSGKRIVMDAATARIPTSGGISVRLTAWERENPPPYLAVDLILAGSRRYYASEEQIPFGPHADIYKTDVMLMRRIPAGGVLWRMGQPYPDGEACGYGNESAITSKSALLDDETGHMVRLTDDYYIGVYEVTQGQMIRIAGTDSSNYKPTENRLLHPTEYCSFEQLRGAESGDYKGWPESEHAVGPSSLLQTLRSHTGVMFDLPTEAQWEFACRAGTGTPLNSGKELSRGGLNAADANMDEVGWYYRNCDEGAHHRPVGLKAANAFGLHDMHGNVGELCLDRAASGADYRATFATGWEDGAVSEDPEGAGSGTLHTARGGCYFFEASLSRSAVRYHKLEAAKQHKMVGFRLVCPVGSDWK